MYPLLKQWAMVEYPESDRMPELRVAGWLVWRDCDGIERRAPYVSNCILDFDPEEQIASDFAGDRIKLQGPPGELAGEVRKLAEARGVILSEITDLAAVERRLDEAFKVVRAVAPLMFSSGQP